MHNFCRAVRLALEYRWTIAGTVFCSLVVAVFWGGNIGALYPVIKVALGGRSLQEGIAEDIRSSQKRIDDWEKEQRDLRQQLAQPGTRDRAELTSKLDRVQYDLEVERRALGTRQRLQPWIDQLLPHDAFQTVVVIVVVLLTATMLKGLFVFVNSMLVARLEQRVTYDLRRQFYHQALRLDLAAFGQERTSGLVSRFHADIGYLTCGIKNLFGCAVREPLKMLACLVGASIISWRLLVFSLVLTPLAAWSIRKLGGSMKRANRRALEEITHLYRVLTETFNGIQTVQAYTLEQSERTKFYRVSKACLQKAMRIALYGSLAKPLTETVGIGIIALALLGGAYLTLNQQTHLFGIRICDRPLDLASLLVFYGLLIGTTEPARKLSEIFNSIQAGLAAADRLFPLLDREPTIVNPPLPQPLPARHQSLVFQNVHFHYVPGTPVLCGIDLEVPFGETLAIVGPNGCGKSTLVQLIPRFFDPVRGSLRINGIDLRQLRLKDLRQKIGMVTQQAILFDDTVYNNIRNGRLDARQAEIVRAAKQARAHRFIVEKLAHGYDTIVGTEGSKLSGGQRQRIALARAIVRDPEILILDEPTSQIDLESEQLIQQALEEFARQRTVFLITHRLSMLSLAHRILVMNAGRIVDIGTHEELLARCDLYRRLYAIQFQQTA